MMSQVSQFFNVFEKIPDLQFYCFIGILFKKVEKLTHLTHGLVMDYLFTGVKKEKCIRVQQFLSQC